MVTPEQLERTKDIWRQDQWARRTVYVTFTLAFAALGTVALGEIGLGLIISAGAGWMGYNAINYFN